MISFFTHNREIEEIACGIIKIYSDILIKNLTRVKFVDMLELLG